MNRCPHCFASTNTGPLAAFVCTGSCPMERDELASRVLGVQISSRPITVPPAPESLRPRRPTETICSGPCGQRTWTEVCMTCHQPFPVRWRDCETTNLVLAGARTSGKTVYIAVLVHQLKLLARELRVSFEADDDVTAREYAEKYEEPLFSGRRLFASTPAARREANRSLPPPLVFRMGRPDGRLHRIVIRDLPGENLERRTLDPDMFGFLGRADGVVFLIDPFQVRSIREMLSDVLPEPEDLGAEAQFVLENLTRLLRRTSPNDRVDVPVAVLLSKFDAMQELRHIDDPKWRSIFDLPGAAFQRDPSLEPRFDPDDSDLLQAEVRSLLHLLHADDLLIQLDSAYRHCRLFVTSALGNAPRASALHANGIAPFRVLDPVKWLLRDTRVLSSG